MLTDLSESPWLRRILLAVFLLAFFALTFGVMQPFIVPLIWGVILAYVCWPLNLRFLKLWRGRVGLAALTTTLFLTLIIVVPIVLLVFMVRVEAVNAYSQVQAFLASNPELPAVIRDLPWVGQSLQDELTRLSSDPAALRQELVERTEQSSLEISRLIGGVGRNLVKMFFAVLSVFFLLRDGPRVLRETKAVLESILGPRVQDYLQAVGTTTQAVVYALFLGAIAQGAVAGVGYWIVGIEAPILLGAATALIALIPFGAPMVWGSLAIWQLAIGNVFAGVGLLLWGMLVVSWMDNIVRPLVISNATRMPFLLVVFGVLGGVLAFGLVGLFIGPVVLAVALALWREWLEQHQPTSPQSNP